MSKEATVRNEERIRSSSRSGSLMEKSTALIQALKLMARKYKIQRVFDMFGVRTFLLKTLTLLYLNTVRSPNVRVMMANMTEPDEMEGKAK